MGIYRIYLAGGWGWRRREKSLRAGPTLGGREELAGGTHPRAARALELGS
tara:strand:- start:41 stop:190 length:150 start_codon:yes stop_codon:yes gene_type:complete